MLGTLSRMTSAVNHTSAAARIKFIMDAIQVRRHRYNLRSHNMHQMRPSQTAIREHELVKYLQLLPVTDSDSHSHRNNAAPFSYTLPKLSTLRCTLVTNVELLRLRMGVSTCV